MTTFIDVNSDCSDLGVVNLACIRNVTAHYSDYDRETKGPPRQIRICMIDGHEEVADMPLQEFIQRLGGKCLTAEATAE